MNFFTGLLFGLMFAATAGAAFAFMWKSMSIVQDELKKSKRNRHPEMEEVNDGDELLVFKGLEDPDDK